MAHITGYCLSAIVEYFLLYSFYCHSVNMWLYTCVYLLTKLILVKSDYDYLDPTKLQTRTPSKVQEMASLRIISKYSTKVTVNIDTTLFSDKKDVFQLKIIDGKLHIKASTGVAALWGFNYYLKKYCKSHIGWQVKRVVIPNPLPEVDESIIANDKYRYYQNVCTVSYSFVWWDVQHWLGHVEWMALNGINLALAPIAQEAVWARVYNQIGMTEKEINEHFTGPAFLSWLRMGNVRGWAGPLFKSWHERQTNIQEAVVDLMFRLGMVPIYPAFSGHVPKAFSRVFPKKKFLTVNAWNGFSNDYCCPLFIDPKDPLFITIGKMFLKEVTAGFTGHIYNADSFNEISVSPFSTELVVNTATAMLSIMTQIDDKAVWLIQNWLFVNDVERWPKHRVKAYLTSVPIGRMLILDIQAEHYPQFVKYDMYYGHYFVWCMLHNFGGNLGMQGITESITKDVYKGRVLPGSTMIGVGLTPEGINQNYVLYDLMLEAAWRKVPLKDLESWTEEYAERRYGCNTTSIAWRHLFRSVYNYTSADRLDGQFIVISRPTLQRDTNFWYKEHDLFEAFKIFAFVGKEECRSPGFEHDLVDITRQALQFRSSQIYNRLKHDFRCNISQFNTTMNLYLDLIKDMEQILASNDDFTAAEWFEQARNMSADPKERQVYEFNARNQITLWGPNGEIMDYAGKQWAELFHYYYKPRWAKFLALALDAKVQNKSFDESVAQSIVFNAIEKPFETVHINKLPKKDSRAVALSLYEKWGKYVGVFGNYC